MKDNKLKKEKMILSGIAIGEILGFIATIIAFAMIKNLTFIPLILGALTCLGTFPMMMYAMKLQNKINEQKQNRLLNKEESELLSDEETKSNNKIHLNINESKKDYEDSLSQNLEK